MAGLYYYRHGGFPPASKYLDKIWQSKLQKKHRKRLKNAKGTLDLTPPRNMSLTIQLNRTHVEQQRQAEIDKQNLVIIEKITEIKTSSGRVDHFNKSWKPSNDRLKKFRQRKQRQLDHQNKMLAERLQNAESYYDAEEWEKDYKKHLYYLSMIESSTKDYDSIEYEDDDFEKEENSGEDDNDGLPPVPPGTPSRDKKIGKQKTNEEEDNVSLPPIDEKGKKNEKKKKDEGGYSEQVAIMDSEEIHTAIEENDKEKILQILGRASEKEKLKKLSEKYKEMYDKDLLEDVGSKVDEDVQNLLKVLSSEAAVEDAKRLNEAMKGLGTDEDTIIEILCTRNNKQLRAIREEYQKQFDKSLEEDLKGDTSGDVETLLIELSRGQREETKEVDGKVAKKDTETLIEAGVGSWGTNESDFTRVFTQRSLAQLAAMYGEYKKLAKMDIEESIDKEMDGDLQKTFLYIVKHSRNPSGAQADKLTKALEKGDTPTVARIILPMNKAQLSDLCSSYKKNTKKELIVDVDKKCSGDLKQMLMAKLDADKKKDKGKKTDNIGKDGDKLPPVGKKPNQQKKKEQGTQGKGKDGAKDKTASKPAPAKKPADAGKGKKDNDATLLHKAIEANDKKKIKEIIVQNATEQAKLKKLADNYKKQHQQDLLEAVDTKIDEDLHEAVAAILLPASEYDARTLHLAMKGVGTNETLLIEILCTRTNAEIDALKKDYKKKYEKSLEEDVKSETSGDFENLLIALLQGKRVSTKANADQAHKDAETLIEAGIKKWGTDEDKFIEIFTTRSFVQLQLMLPEYAKWAKCDVEDSITSELDGDLQKGLLTLVSCVRDLLKLQRETLRNALQENDIATVARIIAGKNEEALKDVETSYNALYKPKLYFEVEKRCSAELKKLLLPKLKDKTQDKTAKKSQKSEPKKQANEQNKESESSKLYNAIKKTDKKTINEIVLSKATEKTKMKKLAEDYQKQHKEDLIEQLDSKIDDDVHEAIVSMLLPSSQADARILFYAMKGIGTKESQLIEILCTRNNEEIRAITSEYRKKYGRSLEEDIKGDTSGELEKLLIDLLKGKRDESDKVDDDLAHKDASTLYEAGVKKWGTDEDKFIEVLTTRSNAHLQAMMVEYEKLAGVELRDSIKDELDGDLCDGLVLLLSCVQDDNKIQADKLYTALQDGDTSTVARIIAPADQAKMSDIEAAYNLSYEPKLYFEVNKKCSENLKKIILHKLKDKKQEKKKPQQKAGSKKQSNASKNDKKPQPKKSVGAAAKDAAVTEEEDSTLLYKAIDKNDKKEITEIIVKNATEANKIKKLNDDYLKRYNKDLVEELDSKIDDDLHEAVTALLLQPSEADARSLYYAMKGVGTHEVQLIEILCTKSNEEIAAMKKEYQKKYGRSLEQDVKSETSGDFENLLIALMKENRDESSKVNEEQAREDASTLYEAGVKKWGTDEDKFIEVLTTRSNAHLQAMMVEYEKLAGVELRDSIKDELDGDLCDGLVLLLSCVQDDNKTQADKLYTALQDGDTSTVARIIAAAHQAKMKAVEESYNSSHDPKLYFEVDKKCSEDLKKIILDKLKDKSERKKTSGQDEQVKTTSNYNEDTKPRNNDNSNDEKDKNNNNTTLDDKPTKNDQSNVAENGAKTTENGVKNDRPKIDIQKVEYHGAVVAATSFDAAKEAEKLQKAMKGFGSDEDEIITVLTSCNSVQRQDIIASYKQQFEKDLVDELKSELGGKFEESIVGLMSSPAVYDAHSLNASMKGLGTQEGVLIEILCSRSSKEIQDINKTYKANFEQDLTEIIKEETSGDFCALLTSLLEGKRLDGDSYDEGAAYNDAERLYEAGEKKWGTDESMFINILTTRSPVQLKAIFQAYQNVSKKDIVDSIDEELEGDFKTAIKTLVTCIKSPPEYFAESLHDALTGVVTNSTTVSRIIITRSEIDLVEIKSTFQEKYSKSLASEVKDSLKGDQETLLLQLLRE